MRQAQTPKIRGVPQTQLNKFKKARQVSNLKDMVVIYKSFSFPCEIEKESVEI